MTVKQPSDLVRLISNVPVSSDGSLVRNTIIDDVFVSPMYTPTYAVSVLARLTLDVLNRGDVELTDDRVDPNSITSKVINSDLSYYEPSIYLLLRAVILESFSFTYHIENDREKLRYASERDVRRVKDNINYLADYMSTEEKYLHMIEVLRDMYISFGYIEHQIDVIVRGVQ